MKQDLSVLYKVRVFRVDRKNKITAFASNWLKHFRLLLKNSCTEFWKQDINVLYKDIVSHFDRKNKITALVSDWLKHFRLLT